MKNTVRLFTTAILLAAMLTGCEKNITNSKEYKEVQDLGKKPVKRAWADYFTTTFGFVPDIAGGWVNPNPAPAWYPGFGSGNATHMGNAKTYFNQKALFTPDFQLVSIPQPVTMFYAADLAAEGITGIPDHVSSVVYDKKGNSVWFESLSSTTTPVSPTRIEFSATQNIAGGTGKFAGATGSVTLTGYFNPTNPEDAASGNSGWIVY